MLGWGSNRKAIDKTPHRFDYLTGIAEYDGEHLRVLPPSFK